MTTLFRKQTFLFLFLAFTLAACTSGPAQSQSRKSIAQKQSVTLGISDGAYTVLQRWLMPSELTEISGMAFYKNLLAAIQDEDGIIFLFNPATGTVERQISFAGRGDYEGIAVVGETAWVLRSDGQLFEVENFSGKSPVTRKHTALSGKKLNVEGLFYDATRNRLLISVKDNDPNSSETKGVYAYDLRTGQLAPAPVYRLKATAEGVISGKKKGEKGLELRPSEIALHPTSGELYVLDGPSNCLYVMGADGVPKIMYRLHKKDLPQAEGLAFEPGGMLYISTEGGKGNGAILKVRLEP